MSVNDAETESATDVFPGAQVPLHLQRLRSRKFLVVAIVLVVAVITVSTLAQSKLSESFIRAQHRYQRIVTPVERADVIFNGGASTAPDHSLASTRTLALALASEYAGLRGYQWPKVAAANIAQLAIDTRDEERLLQELESAPNAGRAAILHQQSQLLDSIESTDFNVLKELKLPTPTNVSHPAGPAKKVP